VKKTKFQKQVVMGGKTGGYGGENRWLWGGATSGEYWYRLFARHKFFLLFFIEFYRIL